MIAGFITLLICSVIDVILQATRLQQNNDDGRAWLSMLGQLLEMSIIVWMLIYYLLNIQPIVSGR